MTTYNVLINNKSQEAQNFFLFQKPAKYVGGSKIYSNSIYHTQLSSGAQANVTIEKQFFAGVQKAGAAPKVGNVSGSVIVEEPINLASSSGTSNDEVTVGLNPLSLTLGNSSEVEPGAFRIVTPPYNPASTGLINIGLATTVGAEQVLSSFIQAEPNKNTDCQPIITFYVATGSYQAGTVINFDTSSVTAAECNATTGTDNFLVTYNPDGTWTVKPLSASAFAALAA